MPEVERIFNKTRRKIKKYRAAWLTQWEILVRNVPRIESARAQTIDNTSKSALEKQILIWDLSFSKQHCWGFTYSWMWSRAVWSVVYDISNKGSGFETTATTQLPEGLNPQALIFQWRLVFQKNPVTALNVTTNVTTIDKSGNYSFLLFPWFMSLKPEICLSAL